jgi:uncharacterized protein
MLFNVSLLLREPIGARREFAIDEEWTPDDAGAVRVLGAVGLLRTDKGVLATAVLATELNATCDRCLCPVRVPLRLEFSEEFFPVIDPFTGWMLPEPEEPTPFRIDEHHLLDLDEAVRQAWLLTRPMRVLCRENCAGLCPECGADLNRGLCRCAQQAFDPRWQALAALRDHGIVRQDDEEG